MRTQTFTQHLQAFMDIYKHFKRQSLGHRHDVLLKTRRLSRKNIKEREKDITPHPVSQILTRSHKCQYFRILKLVQLEENKCLHSPLNKACCQYLNPKPWTQAGKHHKTTCTISSPSKSLWTPPSSTISDTLSDALPSPGVNPLEGSPKR
jgi:hypothetical protein